MYNVQCAMCDLFYRNVCNISIDAVPGIPKNADTDRLSLLTGRYTPVKFPVRLTKNSTANPKMTDTMPERITCSAPAIFFIISTAINAEIHTIIQCVSVIINTPALKKLCPVCMFYSRFRYIIQTNVSIKQIKGRFLIFIDISNKFFDMSLFFGFLVI